MSKNKQKEIGFGSVSATGNARALNPDGTRKLHIDKINTSVKIELPNTNTIE